MMRVVKPARELGISLLPKITAALKFVKVSFKMLYSTAYFLLQMNAYRAPGTQELQRCQDASQRETTNKAKQL